MINPDLIRTFLALAEAKHFTKTAEQLHMTQPGVSQHLRKLEDYFRTPLIQKRGKRFTLTDAGKRLVGYGNRLFEEHRKLQEGLAIDDPDKGSLRFASPGSFAFKVFDTCLEQARRHRELKVEVVVAPNASITNHLREERVDVGFMSEEPKDLALEYSLFSKEELLLALPKGKRAKTLDDLKELGYVNHPDGFHYAEQLLTVNFRNFSGMGDFPISVFINQINRILDPVVLGLGFAILPETACRRYHRRNAISLVSLPKKVEEPLYKVIRRGERLPSRYAKVLERLAT